MKTCTMERIEKHAKSIKAGHEKVKPGEPARFTEGSVAGDSIAQGDLYIMVMENGSDIPKDYVEAKSIQLVPGTTQGSRHCLDSLQGVTMYKPANWTGEDLRGPILVLSEERTVLHPTHGAVTIPAGFMVSCMYQPEYDAEMKRERRNAD